MMRTLTTLITLGLVLAFCTMAVADNGIFEDFEADFLLRNVEKHLFWGVANPLNWFRQGGRTEMAIRYYNDKVFHGATFADMNAEDGPLILINASDMGHGVRFSFIQEYFNLISPLCL